MAGMAPDPDDDLRTAAPADVLARARRVGPDLETEGNHEATPDSDQPGPEPDGDREFEPWDIAPPPPRAPRLLEQSVDEVFARISQLTLGQARAFLRAYQLIPRSELEVGGWAPGFGTSAEQKTDQPTLDQIVTGRAMLREGAIREARANGAQVDSEQVTARAREAVVEALSHASLRGGGIEEATVAAEMATQDTALALLVRPWISEWRFQELVEPWVKAFTVVAVEAHSFDVLGAVALALGVIALASFGIGQTSLNTGDAFGLLFAALTAVVLTIRWRLRRTPAAA